MFLFFFFKQKTAYEMRISDWSSDVCSSDLPAPATAPDHPSITDAFDALRVTAQDFEVVPGMSMANHLWTHAAPLRSGEVASTLIRGGPAGHAIPGFLLLYAVDARSPLLYLPQRQPLRIRDGIEIAPETAGGRSEEQTSELQSLMRI